MISSHTLHKAVKLEVERCHGTLRASLAVQRSQEFRIFQEGLRFEGTSAGPRTAQYTQKKQENWRSTQELHQLNTRGGYLQPTRGRPRLHLSCLFRPNLKPKRNRATRGPGKQRKLAACTTLRALRALVVSPQRQASATTAHKINSTTNRVHRSRTLGWDTQMCSSPRTGDGAENWGSEVHS